MKIVYYLSISLAMIIVSSCLIASPIVDNNAPINTIVLAVVGKTVPSTLYYNGGNIAQDKKAVSTSKGFGHLFTSHSQLLSPGLVKQKNVDYPKLVKPFFIVSDDNLSRTWLKAFAGKLQAMHALGIVTNLKNKKSYDRIVKKYHLAMMPLNVDKLAREYKLTHYPVIVSQHLIEQ